MHFKILRVKLPPPPLKPRMKVHYLGTQVIKSEHLSGRREVWNNVTSIKLSIGKSESCFDLETRHKYRKANTGQDSKGTPWDQVIQARDQTRDETARQIIVKSMVQKRHYMRQDTNIRHVRSKTCLPSELFMVNLMIKLTFATTLLLFSLPLKKSRNLNYT